MRTTLTLDDDVAARLKQLKGFSSFKEAINEALRLGLNALEAPSMSSQHAYKVEAVDLGRLKIKNVDNIAEILNLLEEDRA
jgi:predicted CopG family antitoxin